jgi:hypothetical protein
VPRFLLFLLAALTASAQSHPGWWTFISPDSKSLIGIEWSKLTGSPFADPLRAELFELPSLAESPAESPAPATESSLGFPRLPCLMASRDFLISSPPLLAGANGGCTAATLREQAVAGGMKALLYKGFTIWIASGPNALSAAQFGDQLALIGSPKAIEAAIDRSLDPARRYSPLLISGARLAHARDLWVVAAELPDPLAGRFVPLDVTARNFEGGITARDGLEVGAILDTPSDTAAALVAASILNSIPGFPAVAKGLQVASNGNSVVLALQVPRAQLLASLRQTAQDSAKASVEPAPPGPSSEPGPARVSARQDSIQPVLQPAHVQAAVQRDAVQPPPTRDGITQLDHVQATARHDSIEPVAQPDYVQASAHHDSIQPAAHPDRVQPSAQRDPSQLKFAERIPPAPQPAAVPVPTPAVVATVPAATPGPTPSPIPEKQGPQVIRIYGLDEGVREIPFPPKQP